MLARHVAQREITRSRFPKCLQRRIRACYGFRLNPSPPTQSFPVSVSIRKGNVCLQHFLYKLLFSYAASFFVLVAFAEAQAPGRAVKAHLPPENEIWMGGIVNESNQEWRYLKGEAKVQTSEMVITADNIDYNSDTHWAYARGHVHLEHFATGDKLNADHGEYNLETEEGRFYEVTGTSPAKIISSPWVLTTTNPFYFQAQWAERIKNRYILHHGFVTDCKMPKPWWTFQAPLFDIIPGDRAIARHAIFRL